MDHIYSIVSYSAAVGLVENMVLSMQTDLGHRKHITKSEEVGMFCVLSLALYYGEKNKLLHTKDINLS